MLHRLLPWLLALCLLLPAGPSRAERPAAARPEQGGGMAKLPWQSWIDPGRLPPRPVPQRRDRIVYAFDQAGRTQLTADLELSKLCRTGRFNQLINLHYRAFGPQERAFGVAYGRMAVNLYDPLHRRQEDTVYFFRDQDTTRCAVFKARQADLRRFYIGP